MAYGQTGAGKTYTMLGNREENGIIQRSLKDIFRLCDPETDSIGIAFYEIYNEKVFDLLSQSSLKGKITIISHYMCVCPGPPHQGRQARFGSCLDYGFLYALIKTTG